MRTESGHATFAGRKDPWKVGTMKKIFSAILSIIAGVSATTDAKANDFQKININPSSFENNGPI